MATKLHQWNDTKKKLRNKMKWKMTTSGKRRNFAFVFRPFVEICQNRLVFCVRLRSCICLNCSTLCLYVPTTHIFMKSLEMPQRASVSFILFFVSFFFPLSPASEILPRVATKNYIRLFFEWNRKEKRIKYINTCESPSSSVCVCVQHFRNDVGAAGII